MILTIIVTEYCGFININFVGIKFCGYLYTVVLLPFAFIDKIDKY